MASSGGLGRILRKKSVIASLAIGSAAGFVIRKVYTSIGDDEAVELNPVTFAKYVLVDKQPINSTSSIFSLSSHRTLFSNDNEAGEPNPNLASIWKRGVWSVQIKQPALQIARAYTPLPPISLVGTDGTVAAENGAQSSQEFDEDDIRLLIRKEQNGEVSGYLHRLADDANLELRGPKIEFEVPDDVADVLFLAGGTGIAPALQVAYAVRDRGVRMHILWANRRREDCVGGLSDNQPEGRSRSNKSSWWDVKKWLQGSNEASLAAPISPQQKGPIVRELLAMKRETAKTGLLSVDYFVDEENLFIKPSDVNRFLRETKQSNAEGSKTNGLILISGPDGFVQYWAGRKLWANGVETQGPLGGQLAQMPTTGWRVWKL